MAVQELPTGDEAANNEVERTPSSYHALYAHWERSQWSPLDLDLETDARSFRELTPSERDGLIWIFAHRFHAEFNVARLLAPFLGAAPTWEMQLLLAGQTADEHRHLQAVLRIYDEVFGVSGIDAVRELADRNLDVAAETLYEAMDRHVSVLAHDRNPDLFLKAIVVYHLIAEGVVARTAQNLAGPMYDRRGDFPGLSTGQRLVARDEARHIGIGVTYCRERMAREPERTRELIGEIIEEFAATADDLLVATQGMEELAQSGYGVGPDGFYAEAMRLLNLRLRPIGFIESADGA